MNRAASEAQELNHPWIGDNHLVLGLLHPDCPGAARMVLESFGIRREPFRQAFIASMGDPWDDKPTHTMLPPATQLILERANFEAARVADTEVTSEHVLLALIGRGHFPSDWVARSGITADAARQRVLDATEGVVLPEPPEQLQPSSPYGLGSEDTLDLAPTPSATIPAGGAPGVREASGSRWTGHPRRGCWDGSTSSTVTATRC
jgi:ATP-dependent Clp protease ATP-binding subunit ClpA